MNSDHNQKLPLPLCICKSSSPAAPLKALYSCQVSVASTAETWAAHPARQVHCNGEEKSAAVILWCRQNFHCVPVQAPGVALWCPEVFKVKK